MLLRNFKYRTQRGRERERETERVCDHNWIPLKKMRHMLVTCTCYIARLAGFGLVIYFASSKLVYEN